MSWLDKIFGSRPKPPASPPSVMPAQMPVDWYLGAAGTLDHACREVLKRRPEQSFYGTFFFHTRENGMTGDQLFANLRQSAEGLQAAVSGASIPDGVSGTLTLTQAVTGGFLPSQSEAWYLDVVKTIFALAEEEKFGEPSPTFVGTLMFLAKEHGYTAERLRDVLRASPEWEEAQKPKPGGGSYTSKVEGRLRVEDNKRWFANDAGRFDYREISAFTLYARWLMGQEAHVIEWARKAKAHKANVLRVILTLGGDYWDEMPKKWFGHGLPCGPRVPGFYDRLGEFCDAMAAEGLYVRLVVFGDIHEFVPRHLWPELDRRGDGTDSASKNVMREYVRQTVERVKNKENVILEMANEYGNIGFQRQEEFLVECARIAKSIAPATILNLSVKDGAESNNVFWIRRPADFVSSHLERWLNFWELNWIKRSGESDVIDQEHVLDKMPYLCGEPTNMGDWRRDGRNSDVSQSLAAAFCYGAVSRTRQYNTTFHHDDGLWCAGWGPATDASLDAWRRGLDAIPMLTGDKWRGHWAHDAWRADIYPPTDDENDTKHHVQAKRGPFRIFGTHQFAVTIGAPANWDHTKGLNSGRKVKLVDKVVQGEIECAVYEEV